MMMPSLSSRSFAPMVPAVVRVLDFRAENHDTFTIDLSAPEPPWDAGNGFAFRPGQFNMLYLFATGEVPISMSGNPSLREKITHTIRAVGSVTRQMAKLQPGQAIGLRGPFGTSWPMEQAAGKDLVLVTGGIGLAPLRPVILSVLQNRADYGRFILLSGCRSPADMIFVDELRTWQASQDIEAYVTVDVADSTWTGSIGLVTTLFQRLELDRDNTIGMMCGPEIMMHFTVQEFLKRRIPPEHLYLSLERNMQCAIGFCGHCQLGPEFICMDGPVFRYDRIERFLKIREA